MRISKTAEAAKLRHHLGLQWRDTPRDSCPEINPQQPHQQVNNAVNKQFEPPARIPAALCVAEHESRCTCTAHAHTGAGGQCSCMYHEPWRPNWPLTPGRRGLDEGLVTRLEGGMDGGNR